MKKLSVKEVVSSCCNAPITGVNINGESSAWCEKCGKPHLPSKTRDSGTGITKEMIDNAAKYSNEKQAELAGKVKI